MAKCHNDIKKNIEKNQYSVLELITEMHIYLLNKFINDEINLHKFTNIINNLKNIEQKIFSSPPNDIAISSFIVSFY